MYVGSIALVHRRLMAITICLDYLHQVIILCIIYIISIGLGLGDLVIKANYLLGFRAKWFIGFKAFMGHI